MRFGPKIVSGGAPGFNASNAGDGCPAGRDPALAGCGVAGVACNAGRSGRGFAGMGRSGLQSADPVPPIPLCGLDEAALSASPPVILIPAGPVPAPGGGGPGCKPVLPVPLALPPGTPGWVPSGEIRIRAERFPAGTCTAGVGGAGVADSAMMFLAPASPPLGLGPSSGAGSTSFDAVRGPALAIPPSGTISSFGRGMKTSLGAMFKSPASRCSAGMTGAAVSGSGRLAPLCLSRDILNVSFGRGGCARWFHCTMLGSAGRIFGASGGESGWINVCRGCVGRAGAERMICRG